MYRINDQQIDYILNDISARGVGMEGLQLNLLDHICCIIEQELEENGDFEQFYSATIRKFYKDRLSEIEEETHLLLTNKNYYVMKKVMIYSGAFSAAALTIGIIFKYMHSPGAAVLITLGIGIASLVFLPIMVTLKIKEQQKAKDKLLMALGSFSAIMLSLAILFKIQHWPGANVMGVTSPAILALVFLPIYFFSGIRNPETKVNTIVSSVLIILGIGLFFSLTITPQSMRIDGIRATSIFLRSQQILKKEEFQVAKFGHIDSSAVSSAAGLDVFKVCEDLKASLLEYAAGVKTIGDDFESKNEIINSNRVQDFLAVKPAADDQLKKLSGAVYYYNKVSAATAGMKPIPIDHNILDVKNDYGRDRVMEALNDIVQIQMHVLQNMRELSAPNHKELVSVQ